MVKAVDLVPEKKVNYTAQCTVPVPAAGLITTFSIQVLAIKRIKRTHFRMGGGVYVRFIHHSFIVPVRI